MLDALLNILNGFTDIPFVELAWSHAPDDKYGVITLDNQIPLNADADPVSEKMLTGFVDVFVKKPKDLSTISSVENALKQLGIWFALNSVQFEDDTGYVHYEWEWRDSTNVVSEKLYVVKFHAHGGYVGEPKIVPYGGEPDAPTSIPDYTEDEITYSPNEGSDWQPFKFGGKESLTRVGLDLYDFGARMYSPSNMRWMTMDPLCEKHFDISPYAYCSGDPINRFDPDGMFDKKMFWSGVADILGGVALTTSGAAACAGTGGVGAALGGSTMLVEGISEICGGVTAVVEGCVLDAPEEGEQRFTPTGIIGTTAQGIDMAIGNDDFEVYHTVNAVMSLTGGIGLIKNLDKAIKIGRVSKSELIEMLSTSGQVTTTIAQKIEDNNNEANNDDQSSADTGQGSSGVNVGKDANPYIMWYNPSF